MKKIISVGVLIISLFIITLFGQNSKTFHTDPDQDGYVPNAETAIKIAEAIWLPIYGNIIYDSKPFKATLKDDKVWIVKGTLHEEKGGVPYAEIQKMDCKVLKVIHTQ